MFWNKFVELCNQKGVSPNFVARELGITSGTVTSWKKGGTPRDTTLRKIADYFGVSVDYLLGRDQDFLQHCAAPEKEKEPPLLEQLNNIMKDMTEEELEELNRYVDYLVNRKKG